MPQLSAPFNRDIENFILTAEFMEMDFDYGMQQFNSYLQDLLFLSAGGKYKDLGISERRKESAPRLISFNEGAYGTVTNWDLYDGNTPKGSIALLKLSGVMRTQGGISSPGMDRLVSELRSAYTNDNISGIIIDTYSGGGESSAGNLVKAAIMERNKPVVGLATMAASAAYRALSGADEIIAMGDQAEFGSIGTMITLDKKAIDKFRERFMDIYGEDAPNKNGEHRAAIGGDYSKLQKRVSDLTRSFHEEIKRDRPLRGGDDMIKDTLSGSMFPAKVAQKRGLVDAVGNLPYAIKRVVSLNKAKY